jgi:hypothetical protein
VEHRKHWQRILMIPIGMMAVALFLYKFDPLQVRLQGQSYGLQQEVQIQRKGPFNPFYVKGFKQLDGQYFIVILDGISPEECPCSDLKVRRGKKPNCPVVHHREKKAIIAEGRKMGLPEYNFPVLEVCD